MNSDELFDLTCGLKKLDEYDFIALFGLTTPDQKASIISNILKGHVYYDCNDLYIENGKGKFKKVITSDIYSIVITVLSGDYSILKPHQISKLHEELNIKQNMNPKFNIELNKLIVEKISNKEVDKYLPQLIVELRKV